MNGVNFMPMIVSLGICVVLPIVIVALSLKHTTKGQKLISTISTQRNFI